MLISLEEMKKYLRLDSDYTVEDDLITALIQSAVDLLKSQTGLTEKELEKTKLSTVYICKYVAELFENRGSTENVSVKTQDVLQNIISILSMSSDYKETEVK